MQTEQSSCATVVRIITAEQTATILLSNPKAVLTMYLKMLKIWV